MIGQNEFIIIFIKHAPYITRVHYRDIMHPTYIISMSTRNSQHNKRNTKLVPHALLSYIITCDFLSTLDKCKKHLPAAYASLALLVFVKNPACLYSTLRLVHFYFFDI